MPSRKRVAKPRKPSTKKPATALVLRTCRADMTSRNGFRWPESGPVKCPDWNPVAECGHGLHGLLRGEGDGSLLNWEPDARWLVVEIEAGSEIDLWDKVKFRRGVVVHCGDRISATEYLRANGCAGAIVGGTATAGDRGTATAGYRGTATAGDGGIVAILRWNGKQWKLRCAEVGDDGLKPNTPYRLDDSGVFVEVTK